MSKKTIVSIIVVLIIILASWYFYSASNAKKPVEFAIAKKGDMIQEVSANGRVTPSNKVDLAFEKSGRIKAVYIETGEKVYAGQTLAQIDDSEILAQISQAEAGLKSQQLKLAEMLKGTRQEEINVYEAKESSAKIALSEAQKSAADAIQDAYTKSDDAVYNKADQLFTDARSNSPRLNIIVSDSQVKTDAEWQRSAAGKILNDWHKNLAELSADSDILAQLDASKQNLNGVKFFIDKVAIAVNSLQVSPGITQTTIDGYKAAISTARTNISTAISNLTAAAEGYSSAQSALVVAEDELVLKKTGATEEQINQQKADIEEAEASLENYQSQLAKTYLRSPISGTVSKQDAKLGQIAPAGSILISIISESKLKVEVNVPEADIAKIKIGNTAKITLDAYGDSIIFEAQVTSIDTAETMIDNVPTYKTTLHFAKPYEQIKSGMTANIDILTDKRDNVVSIPLRAIATKNGDKKVKILLDEKTGATKEADIKTGIRDNGGNVEIIEGINEGDRVVVSQ